VVENEKDEKTAAEALVKDEKEHNTAVVENQTAQKENDNAELAADSSKVKRIRTLIIQ